MSDPADFLLANPLRERLRRGEAVAMINPDHPSSALAEFVARQGFHAVFIDCEHGMAGPERVQEMCRAVRYAGATPIVRPEAHREELITRYLDAGAGGLMVPHIEHAEAARELVRAVRYAKPLDWASKLVIAMIESETALGNLDEILMVDGIDVFFVGPGDLSNSMGMPGQMFHPVVRDRVFDACRQIQAAGGIAGTLVNRGNVGEYKAAGFRLLYEHANAFLADGAKRFQAAMGAGG